MSDLLIYGKIIVDDIRLADGAIARNVLGGGGPQAAFGARLWHDGVGFLTRSGIDLDSAHAQSLVDLKIDLSGWHIYEEIPTPYNLLADYDADEYLQTEQGDLLSQAIDPEAWAQLLAQPLSLPENYQNPRAIHLITEFHDEPMVQDALALQAAGVLLSLEPIIDYQSWKNREQMLTLVSQADIVTPDWPSASGIAGSDNPKTVVEYWASLGPTLVAIRHGVHGSYVWAREENRIWHIPVLPTDVVDPTGAGNSYGGGLCAGWVEAGDARQAGCRGTVSARFLVERVGLPVMSEELQAEASRLLVRTLESVVSL